MYGLKNAQNGRGFVFTGDEEEMPKVTFGMTVNKVAEAVQIFGPALYHKNPVRQVNPRKAPLMPIEIFGDPNDPNVQQMYAQMVLWAPGALRG